MNHDPKKPVSLEDLLHLKRSERPPEQFWVQFESELRAKQLTALVDRRPVWSSWSRISQLLARQSLPIGATAVLALGLMSFHQYRAHLSRTVIAAPALSDVKLSAAVPARATVESAVPALESASAAVVTAPSAPVAVLSAPVRRASTAATSVPVVAFAASGDNGSDPFSALMGNPRQSQPAAPTPIESWNHFGDRQLATNAVASAVGFAPRGYGVAVSEPLTHMVNPLDERRAMLLNGSLPRANGASDDDTALSSDDHSASRLSDERLYESVRRLGMGGNSLSVRF